MRSATVCCSPRPEDRRVLPVSEGTSGAAIQFPLGHRRGDRRAKGRPRLLHHQQRITEAVRHEGAGTLVRQPSGTLPDMIAVLGSLDPVTAEVDK